VYERGYWPKEGPRRDPRRGKRGASENRVRYIDMKTQMEIARHRLFDTKELGAKDIKLFPGTNRDTSAEQMAEQVNKAVAQIVSGDFDVVDQECD
jgi:hypothetical protein